MNKEEIRKKMCVGNNEKYNHELDLEKQPDGYCAYHSEKFKKNNKYQDLHLHTTASDGEYDYPVLVEMIKTLGFIDTFAITDHNTIEASKALENDIKNKKINLNGMNFIKGLELSSKVSAPFTIIGSQLHILGYEFDFNSEYIKKILKIQRKNSWINIKVQIDYLKEKGITLTKGEQEGLEKISNVNRGHLARVLTKKGIVKFPQEAFDKFLINSYKSTYKKRKDPNDYEILEIIKKAGGYSSIAHIISTKLSKNQLDKYIKYLKSIGLDAIEVYHQKHNQEYIRYLLELVHKYDLLVSGGSDFHGEIVTPKRDIGFVNGKKIPETSLTKVLTK